MSFYVLLLLLAALLSAVPTTADDGGHASCACLSDEKVANFTFASAAISAGAGAAGYGAGCAAHDEGVLSPDCTTDDDVQELYCASQWCYVDTATCDVEHSISTFSNGATYYSYATCGYLDYWKRSLSAEQLAGTTLRAVLLGNTGGWMGSYCEGATGLVGTESTCTGPMVGFVRDLGAAADFTVEFLEDFPTEVHEACARLGISTSKAFTPCAFATGLGYVDICIAAMSNVEERAQYTAYSPDMYHALFYVVSTAAKDDLLDKALRIFAPFSAYTWLCVLATIACCSAVLAFHEHPHRHTTRASDLYGVEHKLEAMIKSIWLGLRGFVDGATAHEAFTLPGRITNLGFGLFLMLTVSAFTANLVSILLMSDGATISGMDDIISRDLKICVQDSKLSGLLIDYPTAESHAVVCSTRDEVLEGIDSGKCVAGLTSIEELEAMQGIGDHCDKITVGEPISTAPYGMTVSSDVAESVGYWVSNLKGAGKWEERLNQFAPDTRACATAAYAAATSLSLGPAHLLGAFATAGIAIVLSLAIAAYQKRPQRCRRKGCGAAAGDPPSSGGMARDEIEDVNKALDLIAAKLKTLRSGEGTFNDNDDRRILGGARGPAISAAILGVDVPEPEGETCGREAEEERGGEGCGGEEEGDGGREGEGGEGRGGRPGR